MEDIILNINTKESNQVSFFVVETYMGRIKHLKSKQFSGPIKKVDINDLSEANNLAHNSIQELKTILLAKGNIQVSKYKHFIYKPYILAFINFVVDNHIGYYNDSKSKMYSMDRIVQGEFGRAADKNSSFIFNIDSYNSLIIHKDIVAISSNASSIEIEHDNSRGDIIEPKPILYIKLEKTDIKADLSFSYKSIEVACNDKNEFVIIGIEKVFRNFGIEKQHINTMQNLGWSKSTGCGFNYEGNILESTLSELLDNGFVLLTEQRKKINLSANVNYSLSYNVDWFDFEAHIIIDNQTYDLVDLIGTKNLKGNWLEINDEYIFVPSKIIENRKLFVKEDKRFRIKKNQIGNVLELAKDLNIEKINNIENLTEYAQISLDLPDNLKTILREYQIEGVKWLQYLFENGFGGCLADDMGLGKTVQIISFISLAKYKELKVLLIVPKTLIGNWQNELHKFNSELKFIVYHGQQRFLLDKLLLFDTNIVITTYGTLLNDIEPLKNYEFDCVVMDEVQYIKNYASKTHKAVSLLQSKINIALTGTPIENNLLELWSLMNLLNPGIVGGRKDFLNKYSDDLKTLNLKISPFILRRTKNEVLKDLPEKIEQTIYCSMDDEQKEFYDSLLNKLKAQIDKAPSRFEIKSNALILEALLYLRLTACHPKLLKWSINPNICSESAKFETFKNLISSITASGHKVIVFSQFTRMLKIMENHINKMNYKYFYLDGQTNNRQDVIDNFEASDEGIFLISLKAGGVGLNLTSASYAIIYDPWWNPSSENQAADRIHRIGQKNKVFIYRLITQGTIEEKLEELKQKKTEIFNALMENQSEVINLSNEVLRGLIYN